MSFIIPIKIDSRKYIHLPLEPATVSDQDAISQYKGEDEYIVQPSLGNQKPILEFDFHHLLISNVSQLEDTRLLNVDFDPSYNVETNLLTISLKILTSPINTLPALPGNPVAVNDCSFIFYSRSSRSWMVFLNKQFPQENPLYIKIQFEGSVNFIKIHIAPPSQILQAGLDFGSESSQMVSQYANQKPIQFIPFFNDMKVTMGDLFANVEDKKIKQYESAALYRSIFYLNKDLQLPIASSQFKADSFDIPDSEISFMVEESALDVEFYKTRIRTPNMKLILDDDGFIDNQSVHRVISDDGQIATHSFTSIGKSVYTRLQKKIIEAFVKTRLHSNHQYIQFSVLVPNIFPVDNIHVMKAKLRDMLVEESLKKAVKLKGVEISALSESDASFMGASSHMNIVDGKYYLVIDCGKGTTDFSIVYKEPLGGFRPIHKGGFAGAGNLITFAFVEEFIFLLTHVLIKSPSKEKIIKDFFNNLFTKQYQVHYALFFCEELFKFAEKAKTNYVPGSPLTHPFSQSDWNKLLSDMEYNLNEALRFFWEPGKIFDSFNTIPETGMNIARTVDTIVHQTIKQLSPLISRISPNNFSGVLLSGRAFLFAPLKEKMKSELKKVLHLNDDAFFDLGNTDLKTICLRGLFNEAYPVYEDIISTPLELNAKLLNDQNKLTPAKLYSSPFFNWLASLLRSRRSVHFSWQKTNLVDRKFNQTLYLIGSRCYKPKATITPFANKADLLHTREGIKLRTRSGNHVQIHDLLPVPPVGAFTNDINKYKIRSQFPALIDPRTFLSLQ